MSHLDELLLARELANQDRAPADRADFRRLVGPQGPLAGITAMCFLLYREPMESKTSMKKSKASTRASLTARTSLPAARTLLEQVVPRLLAQLNRATQPELVRLRGRARGSVDWCGTVKARAAASYDQTIFVCRQSWRLYDLPENRLLKYVLQTLSRCHERAPVESREWCRLPVGGLSVPNSSVGDELALVAHRLRRFRKNPYLRDVELPAVITVEHELAAQHAHNPLYRRIAEFHQLFSRVIEVPRWGAWRDVVRTTSEVLPLTQARTFARIMARKSGEWSNFPTSNEMPDDRL